MIDQETQENLITILREEALRIRYGKVILTINIFDKNVVSMEAETKRSVNFKELQKKKA